MQREKLKRANNTAFVFLNVIPRYKVAKVRISPSAAAISVLLWRRSWSWITVSASPKTGG